MYVSPLLRCPKERQNMRQHPMSSNLEEPKMHSIWKNIKNMFFFSILTVFWSLFNLAPYYNTKPPNSSSVDTGPFFDTSGIPGGALIVGSLDCVEKFISVQISTVTLCPIFVCSVHNFRRRLFWSMVRVVSNAKPEIEIMKGL